MEDNKIYWFITVMGRCDMIDGFLHTRPTRCWGFYSNKEDALFALHTNMTDMWETIYNYAVLEPYMEGISGYDFETPREWFKYNKNTNSYEPIEEPEGVKNYAGFALG